ncbi:hypothetical protein [Paenisporosarcina sp. NPDC076898]|uniref:hypothetical protein n=1 Tax=unclassified Paenisporosarcina TaxID=2642018 RepID=UPI003D01FB72
MILVTLLFGCSGTEQEPKESDWEELMTRNPELETNQEEIPEDILDKIKIPAYTTIPFQVESVQITPLPTSIKDKDPLLIDIVFIGEQDVLHVSNLFTKAYDTVTAQETVKLSNGIKAKWDEQGDANVISWHDSEDNVDIVLMIPPYKGEKKNYTLKDFLKMANSVN